MAQAEIVLQGVLGGFFGPLGQVIEVRFSLLALFGFFVAYLAPLQLIPYRTAAHEDRTYDAEGTGGRHEHPPSGHEPRVDGRRIRGSNIQTKRPEKSQGTKEED